MNRAIAIIGIIIVLLAAGGVIFYTSQQTTPPPSSTTNTTPTPATPPNTDQVNTAPVQTAQVGTPVVTTNATVAASQATAVLSGTVTPNGAFTNYWYEYGISSDLGNKISSHSQTVGSGFVSIPAPGYITGLTKDTTYYFRLVAENQYGRIAGAQYSFQTSAATPAPTGSAPATKTLSANGISRTTANINGEVTPNGAATQYWFEYGKTANLGNTTAFVSAGNSTDKLPLSVSLSDLDPAATYYFRLNAQNQFGTVNGAILNFKTAGPPSAIAPSVSTKNIAEAGTSTATFRGTVNPNGTETAYWFEYGTDSLFGSASLHKTVQKSVGTGSSTMLVEASVVGLGTKTNYYFRLVAENSAGIVHGERMAFKTK